MATSKAPADTYYDLLGLAPSASVRDIRRAYRDRSKLYHPDTTQLPPELAKAKFHLLNEAYATLSSPERRLQYDQKIGYSRIPVIQVRSDLNRPVNRDRIQPFRSTKDYLDPTDRPLSAGEMFALFLLGITFVACLILVVTIGLTQGESAFRSYPAQVPLDFLRSAHPEAEPTTSQPRHLPFSPHPNLSITPEPPSSDTSGTSDASDSAFPNQRSTRVDSEDLAAPTAEPQVRSQTTVLAPSNQADSQNREISKGEAAVALPPARASAMQSSGSQLSETEIESASASQTVVHPDIQAPRMDDKSL